MKELHQTGKLLLGASAPCWTGDASPVAPLSLAPIVAEHTNLDQGDGPGIALPSPLLVVAEHADLDQGDGPGVALLSPLLVVAENTD